MSTVSEELKQLFVKCEELHRQHLDALSAHDRIHQALEQGESITVHYQCEDRDFGDVLEELHTAALEDIEKGKPVCFGEKLVEAFQYMSFPASSLKN